MNKKQEARAMARSAFGRLVTETGHCLCVYCDRDVLHVHPDDADLVSNGGTMYNCLRCHMWIGGGNHSGFCYYCDPREQGYLYDEALEHPPDELPPLEYFEPGTRLHTRVALMHEAAKVPGILYAAGDGYPAPRFRHANSRWYPLGLPYTLAVDTMHVLAVYEEELGQPGDELLQTKQDKIWDQELASRAC